MKESGAGTFNMAVLIAAASCLLFAAWLPAFGQRGAPGASAVERRMETLNRQGVQYERDRVARDGKGPVETQDKRRKQDVAGQVKRDFEGLQAGYNRIVLAIASGARPDSETILDSVADVRKSAARLRDNLALPQAKGENSDKAHAQEQSATEQPATEPADAARVQESLRLLRKHIYSFVTNPLFEAPAALDVEKAEKAGRDLDMIIELCEAIRKSGARSEKHKD
jgi:hypothetical protein